MDTLDSFGVVATAVHLKGMSLRGVEYPFLGVRPARSVRGLHSHGSGDSDVRRGPARNKSLPGRLVPGRSTGSPQQVQSQQSQLQLSSGRG